MIQLKNQHGYTDTQISVYNTFIKKNRQGKMWVLTQCPTNKFSIMLNLQYKKKSLICDLLVN